MTTPLQARARALFDQLRQSAGLAATGADEPLHLIVSDTVLVACDVHEPTGTIVLAAPVWAGERPLAPRLLQLMLAVNLAVETTEGARFALRDVEGREVVLVMPLGGQLDGLGFETAVRALAGQVLEWRAILEEEAAKETAPADPGPRAAFTQLA